MSCQLAASKSWNIFHIDFKTAIFHGQSYSVNRDTVCQLAIISRSSSLYCWQDWRKNLLMAWVMPLDTWWNVFWTKHCVVMVWFSRKLTDVVMCCTQPKRVSPNGTKGALHRWIVQLTSHSNRVRDQKEMQAFESMLDPTEGSPATDTSVAGIINLFVWWSLREQVEPTWNNVSSPDSNRISEFVQKTVMMCSHKDKEFVACKILN